MEGICSMVGSAIGAGDVKLGKQISEITFVISWGLCLLQSLVVCYSREDVASLFVQDETTQRILVATIPYVCLDTVSDHAQGLLSGTIRALGIQG